MEAVRIACQGARVMDIGKLNPFQGNLKSLSTENYNKLKSEILDLGFSEPISVWLNKEDASYKVLNGHQRLRTLRRMRDDGYLVPEVPVNLIEAKNKKEAKKKILALTSQYGVIEGDGLYEFMHDGDLEVSDLMNFRFPELAISDFEDEYFKQDKGSEIDPSKQDDAPDLPDECSVKLGDVYTMGNHMIMCGDSTNPDHVSKLLDGFEVDSLVTDPPYGVNLQKKNKHLNRSDGGNRVEKAIANDSIEDYRTFFKDFLKLIPFSDYNTCYVFLSSQEIHNLRLAIEDLKFHFSDYLIWLKNNHVMAMTDYKPKHEWIAYFWKGRHKFYGKDWKDANSKGEMRTAVLEYERPMKNKSHPTMKPIELLEQLIEDGSPRDGGIYDPFLGSGSTLIACEKMGRRCRGMELDPKYVDVILSRWENLMGQQPIKLSLDD